MQTGDFISSHRTMPTCRNAAEAGFRNGFQSGSDGISAEECYDVLLLEIDRHSRVDTRRRHVVARRLKAMDALVGTTCARRRIR